MHPDVITTSVWDVPGNVDLLKTMWADGASAAEVAAAIGQGISRSAVIGKVHRLKLTARSKPVPKKSKRGNPGQPKVNGILKRAAGRGAKGLAFKLADARRQGLSTKEAMPLVLGRGPSLALPPEDSEGVDCTHLVGFADRRIGEQCAWIHGDPLLPGSGFCGRPVKEGTSWCPEHHARVFAGKTQGY